MLARDSSHVWQGEQAVLRSISVANVEADLEGCDRTGQGCRMPLMFHLLQFRLPGLCSGDKSSISAGRKHHLWALAFCTTCLRWQLLGVTKAGHVCRDLWPIPSAPVHAFRAGRGSQSMAYGLQRPRWGCGCAVTGTPCHLRPRGPGE